MDYAQICPVKEKNLSKSFTIPLVFKLTKVYRQKGDNPVLDILYELRNTPKYNFKNINSQFGSLNIYNNWNEFLDKNINIFKDMISNENQNHVKLIAYTNARVEAFNKVIRSKIFNNNYEYNVGDILTGYSSCEFSQNHYDCSIVNSVDYIVKKVEYRDKFLYGLMFTGFDLTLYSPDTETTCKIFILSRTNDISLFNALAVNLEKMRTDAVSCNDKRKRNKLWVSYFQLAKSFITPVDLVYSNKIIHKKGLDYGYCITSHKSQGSTYENVLIDMGNILRCTNKVELRQLQYVAMSRTKKDIYLLI